MKNAMDRPYMRTCAIYRLLKGDHIGYAQAVALSERRIRGAHKREGWLVPTIQIWRHGPLREMQP